MEQNDSKSGFSKRRLINNWDRYKNVKEAEVETLSTNFALLSQAPVSHGGHFQFKSDKIIASELESNNYIKDKLFSLDLTQLNYSLSTIPFTLRSGLGEEYFNVGIC